MAKSDTTPPRLDSTDFERVIFLQVGHATTKLNWIAQIAQEHFYKKERLLIVCEDDKALAFTDELLWKFPPNSFLPHAIINVLSTESIALTKEKKNLNDARFAFNLCSTPLLIEGPFRFIYDFEDTSSPNKKLLSQMRFDAYKQARFSIESRQFS